MADPRFFQNAGPITLARLADIAGAKLQGTVNSDKQFQDVKPLDTAETGDVSFIDNRRYIESFVTTQAGAVLVSEDLVPRAPAAAALLVTGDPYRGYAMIAQAFYPYQRNDAVIHPGAQVDDSAIIDHTTKLDAGATILANASVGARCQIGANTVICEGVVVGDDCRIAPNVTLSHCILGNRVIVHPGVRVGQDGFGFAPGAQGHEKVPQLGRVIINDDVEVGANTTIDRGAGPDTIIGAGTKIDNLVQIGHNVEIGEGCFVVAQVGISGSTKVGDFAMIGGQAGIVGHITIGSGARIAAQSGISRDVPAGQTVAGSPASEAREHWKQLAMLRRMTKGKGQ